MTHKLAGKYNSDDVMMKPTTILRKKKPIMKTAALRIPAKYAKKSKTAS